MMLKKLLVYFCHSFHKLLWISQEERQDLSFYYPKHRQKQSNQNTLMQYIKQLFMFNNYGFTGGKA